MFALLASGTELKRLLKGTLPKLGLLAIILLPLAYGALYLWSFKNPPAHLDRMPIALVNEDQNAVNDGKEIHLGTDLVNKLEDNDVFKFSKVDPETARKGVKDGSYYFSITIPQNFSESVTTVSTDAPRKAQLQVEFNDANSFLAGTLGKSAMKTVRDAVADQTSTAIADKLLVGLNDASNGFATAADGAGKLKHGSKDASKGSHRLEVGLGTLARGMVKLNNGAIELKDGTGKLANSTGKLASGTKSLASGATKLNNGATKANAGAAALQDGTGKLDAGSHKASQAVANGLPDAKKLSDGAAKTSSGATELATGATAAKQGAESLSSGMSELSKAIGQKNDSGSQTLAGGINQLADGLNHPELIKGINDYTGNVEKLVQQCVQVESPDAKAICAALEQINGTSGENSKALQNGASQIGKAAAGAQTLQQKVSGEDGLADAAAKLAAGASTFADKTSELSDGATALAAGTKQVSDGTAKSYSKTSELSGKLSQLADGAHDAATGAGKLANGTSTLSNGAKKLDTGATTLNKGATKLDAGAGKLAAGASKLHDGIASARPGVLKLENGSASLTGGLNSLYDGTKTLQSKLHDGSDKTYQGPTHTVTAKSKVAGDPINLDATYVHKANDFGQGFAPFFLGLAMYFGAIVIWMLLRPIHTSALATGISGWRIAFSGFAPGLIIGILQALVLYSVVHFALGIHVNHPWTTLWFLMLASVANVALLQLFNILFGAPVARVLSLVFLMVQLTSSGGTYPIETSPGLFRALHPFMPMSYAVTGLRQTTTGVLDGRFTTAVIVLAGLLVVSLVLSSFAAGRQRIFSMRRLHPALTM